MKKQGLSLLILLLAVVLVGTYGHFSSHDRIVAVLDDNTVELAGGRRIHLVGVAPIVDPVGITPATGSSHTPEPVMREEGEADVEVVSPWPVEIEKVAKAAKVVLEFPKEYSGDLPSPDLFAYVRLADGTDLGAWIIQQGYARVDVEHEYERQQEYRRLEQIAMDEGKGIWTPTAEEIEGDVEK